MCMDCVNEHEEFCQEHVNTCEIESCTLCASIWRDVRDGRIIVILPG